MESSKRKDYTEYDFSAIVGAEVEITQYGGHKYSGTLKLVGRQNGAILLYPSDEKKPAYWFVIENIVPGSLTAKIKVEDMSVKQLKRFAKQEVGDDDDKDAHIGMGVNVDVFYIQANFDKRQGYLFDKEYELTDYIDCTDWGWKHE